MTVQPSRSSNSPQTVIFFGPPGSGKGTQASRLSRALSVPAISTGDILRRESESASALGHSVRSILGSGRLVSDELMNEIVARRLSQSDCQNGFILDGYPRTVSQATYLQYELESLSMPEPVILHLDVSVDDIVSRLARRLLCPSCGKIYAADARLSTADPVCELDGTQLVRRSDDNAASIAERIRTYEATAADVISFYRLRNYHRIAGSQAPDVVTARILEILKRSWTNYVGAASRPLSFTAASA